MLAYLPERANAVSAKTRKNILTAVRTGPVYKLSSICSSYIVRKIPQVTWLVLPSPFQFVPILIINVEVWVFEYSNQLWWCFKYYVNYEINKQTELLSINIASQCRLKTSYVLSFNDTIIAMKILLCILINVRYMKFKMLS